MGGMGIREKGPGVPGHGSMGAGARQMSLCPPPPRAQPNICFLYFCSPELCISTCFDCHPAKRLLQQPAQGCNAASARPTALRKGAGQLQIRPETPPYPFFQPPLPPGSPGDGESGLGTQDTHPCGL